MSLVYFDFNYLIEDARSKNDLPKLSQTKITNLQTYINADYEVVILCAGISKFDAKSTLEALSFKEMNRIRYEQVIENSIAKSLQILSPMWPSINNFLLYSNISAESKEVQDLQEEFTQKGKSICIVSNSFEPASKKPSVNRRLSFGNKADVLNDASSETWEQTQMRRFIPDLSDTVKQKQRHCFDARYLNEDKLASLYALLEQNEHVEIIINNNIEKEQVDIVIENISIMLPEALDNISIIDKPKETELQTIQEEKNYLDILDLENGLSPELIAELTTLNSNTILRAGNDEEKMILEASLESMGLQFKVESYNFRPKQTEEKSNRYNLLTGQRMGEEKLRGGPRLFDEKRDTNSDDRDKKTDMNDQSNKTNSGDNSEGKPQKVCGRPGRS